MSNGGGGMVEVSGMRSRLKSDASEYSRYNARTSASSGLETGTSTVTESNESRGLPVSAAKEPAVFSADSLKVEGKALCL